MSSWPPEVTLAGRVGPAYLERRRAKRNAAQRRIAAHARTRLTPAQQAFDPLARAERSLLRRLAQGVSAILSSTAVHASMVGVAMLVGSDSPGRDERSSERVTIAVRERSPDPVSRDTDEMDDMDDMDGGRKSPARRSTRMTRPDSSPAPEPAKPPPKASEAPPKRVVGIQFDSASAGGSGPVFAAGNTRTGTTDARATDPSRIGSLNQAASRIPTRGVKFTLPRRKRPSRLPYPPMLKSQGIEADVTVRIAVDATGKVTGVDVITKSSYVEFNQAAQQAALAEEFDPATREGVATSYSLTFTYRFRLGDGA